MSRRFDNFCKRPCDNCIFSDVCDFINADTSSGPRNPDGSCTLATASNF